MKNKQNTFSLNHMKKLNKSNWNRLEHFKFFSQFDEPFLGFLWI